VDAFDLVVRIDRDANHDAVAHRAWPATVGLKTQSIGLSMAAAHA
jgi:hypothetical protein